MMPKKPAPHLMRGGYRFPASRFKAARRGRQKNVPSITQMGVVRRTRNAKIRGKRGVDIRYRQEECRRVSDVAETEPSGNIGRLAASLAMRAAGGEAVPVRRDATACRRSAAVNANGALTWWVA
jgi:hypothetical protein